MSGKSYFACMEQRLIVNSVLDLDTECWIWIGPRDKRPSTPYGKINVYEDGRTRTRQAHIVSYETFIGPVPAGHELDHTCVNGFCIAPYHLEPVLPAVNIERRDFRRVHTARSDAYVCV
jgi:HNH endonuclease